MLEAVPTVSSGRNRHLAPQASHFKRGRGRPIFDFGAFRASGGAPDRPAGAPDPPAGRVGRRNGRGGSRGVSGAGRLPLVVARGRGRGCTRKGWEYCEGITEVPCNTASAFEAVPTAGVPLSCVFRLFLDKVCSM